MLMPKISVVDEFSLNDKSQTARASSELA